MKTIIALATVAAVATIARGESDSLAWPQFRGPGGSGVANGEKPPVELGPDTNVKWKVPVPAGLSAPIVAGENIVLTAFEDGKLYTIAYRRADGGEAWRAVAPAREIEAYHKTEGSPAASTPATDGERIVSYFGSCGLFCYDLSGKELWKFELEPVVMGGNFGSGVSPIIADGLVILVRDEQNEPRIIALYAATGSRKWQTKRQSHVSYSTPVVWDTPAGRQLVAPGHARMEGYDLKSGDPKWFVTDIPSACCSSPVTADGLLYFAGWSPGGMDDKEFQMPSFDFFLKDLDSDHDGVLSKSEAEEKFEGFFDTEDANKDGFISRDEHDAVIKFMSAGGNSAFALKPGGEGDVTATHVLWKQTQGLPYVASAILYGGQYVMVKDGGIVTAYDGNSGDEVFRKRAAADGKYYASPVAADGHIYFTSLDGAVTVLKASSRQPIIVAQNPPLNERTAATPAIADDTLYVRTEKHLYAFADE